jgi:hypothetical protein
VFVPRQRLPLLGTGRDCRDIEMVGRHAVSEPAKFCMRAVAGRPREAVLVINVQVASPRPNWRHSI